MGSDYSAVLDRQYRTLLVCREMCVFIRDAVNELNNSSNIPGNSVRGHHADENWTILTGHGLVGVAAVFQSMAELFSAEMDRIQQLILAQTPDSSQSVSR